MKSDQAYLLKLFKDRTSIREFLSTSVKQSEVRKIVEIGQSAPTACSLQTYTVMWARNKRTKEAVLNACMVPKAIRNVPVVLVICSDVHRLGKTLDHLGSSNCLKHGGGSGIRLMSILDACFAAQNMVMAAECMGLGSLFIGSAAANQKVIDLMNLPAGVIPLTLLLIGFPDEKPPRRPRLPLSLVLQTDIYTDPNPVQINAAVKHMNNELDKEGYYQKYVNRPSDFHYTDHIKRKTSVQANKRMDEEVNVVMQRNGFFVNNIGKKN